SRRTGSSGTKRFSAGSTNGRRATWLRSRAKTPRETRSARARTTDCARRLPGGANARGGETHMASPLETLEPRSVWQEFDALTKIPRPSKGEERARDHVKALFAGRD